MNKKSYLEMSHIRYEVTLDCVSPRRVENQRVSRTPNLFTLSIDVGLRLYRRIISALPTPGIAQPMFIVIFTSGT